MAALGYLLLSIFIAGLSSLFTILIVGGRYHQKVIGFKTLMRLRKKITDNSAVDPFTLRDVRDALDAAMAIEASIKDVFHQNEQLYDRATVLLKHEFGEMFLIDIVRDKAKQCRHPFADVDSMRRQLEFEKHENLYLFMLSKNNSKNKLENKLYLLLKNGGPIPYVD